MPNPWDKFTNQEQWKNYLQNLIRTNDKALYRSILLIADRQTAEEKAWGATIEHNGRGFGAADAEFMTSMALRIKGGAELTPKMKAICRNKMPKYWKQLMVISKQKQRREQDEKEITEQYPDSGHKPDDYSGGPANNNFTERNKQSAG